MAGGMAGTQVALTRMETQRPLALYTHLQGRGARRHRLPVHGDRGDEGGQRDVPALQSVREFKLEYERLLMHLRELDCELPPLVKWLYLDKLKLSEAEEMSILSSANKYEEPDSEGLESGAGEASDADFVTEEVAAGYHDAYMAYQGAASWSRRMWHARGCISTSSPTVSRSTTCTRTGIPKAPAWGQWRALEGNAELRPPLHWLPTDLQLADVLTKPMAIPLRVWHQYGGRH